MSFWSDRNGSAAKDLGLLLVLFGTLFFQFLGRLPLIDPDEGRYIEIPREMLERGDFITPTLNYVKYFEKPPLQYWLNALALSVFGENEFAARCAGTLCGVATVLLTYYLGRRLFGRQTGLIAAVVLGSAGGFLVQSRINFTDMTLTFCLSGAFAFFLLASRDDAPHKGRDYYLFYAFMGLAVLAKGLIGIVLPAGVILLYLLLTRRWGLLKEMRIVTGTALFLAICAPWFVLVSLKNPEFPHFFFIHEHFQRFLTKVHHRYQPFWFFIPVLAGTMLPWSLFIPAALALGWRARKTDRDLLFLLLWGVVIFVFFSKSSSKLVPYILPVFPPLALLIGKWFSEGGSAVSVRRIAAATGTLLLLLGAVALIYPQLSSKHEIGIWDGTVIGALFICQGAACLIAGRRGEAIPLFLTLAVTGSLFEVAAPPFVYANVAPQKSVKELALSLNKRWVQGARVACYSGYEQGLPFYTHQRMIVVGDRDELEFGSLRGDNSAWFLKKEEFHRLWDSPQPLFAVVKRRDLAGLKAAVATPVRVVAVQGERLLLCNRPACREAASQAGNIAGS